MAVATASAPSSLRAAARLARALAHMLRGLAILTFKFPKLNREQKEMQVQAWSAQMLACLGVELEVVGTPAEAGPLLLVANHISWLDISALHAARYCRFVSKADVQGWPLIGALATGAGTLFIQRESRRDAQRMVHHMAQSLLEGDVLAVFPEGTTGDGMHLLPFHGNLLQAAISANAPVQPVALRFVDSHSGQPSLAPGYVGDDTLLGSAWRTLKTSGIVVQVVFGPAELAQGRERRAWAVDLHATVASLSQFAVRHRE